MRRRLLAVTAAALAAAATPASASSDATHEGWCEWSMAAEPTHTLTPADGFAAVLDAEFVVASPSAGPVGATVTCTYYFGNDAGDVQVEELVVSGTGAIAGTRQVTVRGDLDEFHSGVCVSVDYADDTPTDSVCSVHTAEGPPFGPVVEGVDALVSDVPGARDALCDTLRSVGPAGTRALFVDSDGDVHTGKYEYWDC